MDNSSNIPNPVGRHGLRLIPLRQACERIGISVRSYYLHPHCLPAPTRVLNKLMFAEHEVDNLISAMLAQRGSPTDQTPQQTGKEVS